VLHEVLDLGDVRNYDGSWTEWGSMIGMPIELGDPSGRRESPEGPSAVAQGEEAA